MTKKLKSWKEIPLGGVCWKPATEYYTGDWRTFKPIRDKQKCTKCLLCAIICPDSSITWSETKEDIEFNYNFCKGCGICGEECPTEAIEMVREGES